MKQENCSSQTISHTHIWDISTLHVSGLWEQTREPAENPATCKLHQTPKKTGTMLGNQTQNLLPETQLTTAPLCRSNHISLLYKWLTVKTNKTVFAPACSLTQYYFNFQIKNKVLYPEITITLPVLSLLQNHTLHLRILSIVHVMDQKHETLHFVQYTHDRSVILT